MPALPVRCPNCSSYKTREVIPPTPLGYTGGLILGCSLALVLVGLLIWPLLPFGLIGMFLGALIGSLPKWRTGSKWLRCRACGIPFKI